MVCLLVGGEEEELQTGAEASVFVNRSRSFGRGDYDLRGPDSRGVTPTPTMKSEL